MKTREFVYTTPEIPGHKTVEVSCSTTRISQCLNTCPHHIDFFFLILEVNWFYLVENRDSEYLKNKYFSQEGKHIREKNEK